MILGDLSCIAATSDQLWESVRWVLIYGTIIIAAIVVFAAAIHVWRRRMRVEQARVDFVIEEIENLHRKGLISDDEFSRLRRKALGVEEPGNEAAGRFGEKTDSG
jgi:predicted HicB family RNase H-like nuclease